MQRGNASLDRVNETLSYEPDVIGPKRPAGIKEPGRLVFEQVTFTYPSGAGPAVSDVSFSVEKGQTLGIVGKAGSGKTTIIKQLLREYPPGAGEVTFTGVPIQEIPLEELRGWIGYVPQDHILFSKTVKENLLYGRQDANEEEIGGALKDAHFENDIGMLSDGLETLVGEKGSTRRRSQTMASKRYRSCPSRFNPFTAMARRWCRIRPNTTQLFLQIT